MLDLLYADDLVLCGELEEDLRGIMEHFVEVCRKIGLKVNAGKIKAMVLGGKEGLECKVCVDGIRLEHVSEFKYLGCVWTNMVQMSQSRKVASGRGLQVLLVLSLMIGVCSLSVLESCMSLCSCLFLCMVVRQ